MFISPTLEGGLRLCEIDRGLMALLREAPDAADPRGDSRALDRLYPRPTDDVEEEMNDDWNEYVQPDLQHLFESANQTMRRDLDAAVAEEDGFTVEMPPEHFDAWLCALNQARLVLASRHKIEESDMNEEISGGPRDAREFALLQIHLYGFLQENIIRIQELESGLE